MTGRLPISTFILKAVSRCNLNCSYCYVYNQGDDSWRNRPGIMSEETFRQTIARIKAHCQTQQQSQVALCFHGGEPCLLGPERLDAWCRTIRAELEPEIQTHLVIQTNGTLINLAWTEVFARHNIQVGISIDGPKEIHDRNRVDHQGRGSFEAVAQGIDALHRADIPYTALCVIPMGADGGEVHDTLLSLRPKQINYLLPDLNWNHLTATRDQFGPTPCADFLIPIFDAWWENGTLDTQVTIFMQIARLILGGESSLDTFGGGPLSFLFVEADGDIEGLDVLKVCRNGMARTGFNVHTAEFVDIAIQGSLHQQVLTGTVPPPRACFGCREFATCGGGYLPQRYRPLSGFDNPSIWCADILKLFGHIRERMGVPAEETGLRREILQRMAMTASNKQPV